MKKFSKKSILLFASVMAMAAFAMPAMASAATWSGTAGTLSGTIDLSIPALSSGSSCTATFAAGATGGTNLSITSANFTSCSGTEGAAGCSVSASSNGLPWAAHATSTSVVDVSGVDVDVSFSGASCPFDGQTVKVSGTLGGAAFSAPVLDLTGSAGLVGSVAGTPLGSVTVSGSVTDSGSLTII